MPQLTIDDIDEETLKSLWIESERRGTDLSSVAPR
jgi:hypothetical protein